jgi:hypothetical protein
MKQIISILLAAALAHAPVFAQATVTGSATIAGPASIPLASAGFGTPAVVTCSSQGTLPGSCGASNTAATPSTGLAATPAVGSFNIFQIAVGSNSNLVTSVFATTGIVAAGGSATGGTAIGAIGSTCLINVTNGGGAGAVIMATLTMVNTISGATLTVTGSGTNPGSGYLVPPSAGTLTAGGSNPVATCTSTAGAMTLANIPLNGTSLGSADFVSAPNMTAQSNQAIAWYHLANAPSGIIGFYETAGGTNIQIALYTATAQPTAGTVDVTATGNYNTSATSQTSTNTGTPTANGDLFIGGCSERSTGTYTIGSLFTQSLNQGASTLIATVFGYYQQTTAAPIAFTATSSPAAKYSCGVVGYKPT